MSPLAKIAYADCFSGISGDMFLGALLHCGVDEDKLRNELSLLGLDDFTLTVTDKSLAGIGCKKVDIAVTSTQAHRNLETITSLLDSSQLSRTVVDRAIAVFTTLAQAEAKIHSCNVESVHFHEVGALDAIIDVVGVLIGLEQLGISRIYTSPLPMGRGFVHCEHGTLPLPAPAVCEILKDVPLYGTEQRQELVTPTGAALIKVLSEDFGPMVPMTIRQTGYGAGTNKLENGQPNLFRLFIGQALAVEETQMVEVIETNIDDWSPEGFPHIYDLLLENGALDVSVTPIQMKKGRPGFLLQVIADPSLSSQLKTIILGETSAIGLRFRKESRLTLPREIISVNTKWGEIQAKKTKTPTGVVITPEFESCRKVAREFGISLKEVYSQVMAKTLNKTH